MDHEIQETVEAILGKNVKVIDCEKKSSIKEEEVLLVNGCPVTLDGEDGVAIKEALLRGNIPNCHSLNQILVRVGILKAPVKLETNLSVKSNVVTREEVTVAKGGQVVDERSRETKEDNFYTSNTSEIWEPVGILSGGTGDRRNLSTSSPTIDFSIRDTGCCCSSSGGIDSNSGTSGVGGSSNCSANATRDSNAGGGGAATAAAPKFRETRMSSVSKTYSSDCEDKTDFAYSKHSLTGNALKELPLHALPLRTCDTATSSTQKSSTADSSSDLIYRDGVIVSGTLDSLIQHLVPTIDYYPEKKFLFAFLLTSRLFIKPRDLLANVIRVCESRYNFSLKSSQHEERIARLAPRLIQFLADWIESFPYDFRDDAIMTHVRTITQKCVKAKPELLSEVSALLRNLLQRLTNLEHYEEFLQEVAQNSVKHAVDKLPPGDVVELCSEPKILAQQLCHIELERSSFIGPEEFVQAFAQETISAATAECSLKELKKTRNLESYVKWFNRLSYLVGSEICKHVKKKMRVKVVEYWVEVARECFNIGNFNSLMAIIAGLNLSPVSRLKKTWNKVQSAKFSILEHQMNPTANFSSYRSTLKAAMWRSTGSNSGGGNDDVQQQCLVIPFFSLLIKDIYFLNEGCANRLSNGHINFEKFWQLAHQVSEFERWKKTVCPFSKDLHLITFLQASPVLSEKALLLASFDCEPPENTQEKEQFKLLKVEET